MVYPRTSGGKAEAGFGFTGSARLSLAKTVSIREDIGFPVLAAHVWFIETSRPWDRIATSPLLGVHDGRAYTLLYNGILGDKEANGGNVLTRNTLRIIRNAAGRKASRVQRASDGLWGTIPPVSGNTGQRKDSLQANTIRSQGETLIRAAETIPNRKFRGASTFP